MKRMPFNITVSVVLASGMATLCSLVMAFVMATFVPSVLEGTDINARPPEQRLYTMEELDRAEKEMKAEIKAEEEDKSFEARARVFRSIQRPALWISWLPWILLPFVLSLSSFIQVVLALTFPALMVATTTAPPEEIGVFAVAIAVGMGIRHVYMRIHTT